MYLQHGGHYGPTMFACLTMIADVIAQYFPPGRRPAHTLVGVDALAAEDLLVQIEAIAVIP
jgi:enamine deaminase RidA (YjgF/YER057c/UK114 family)